jgi:hypothetical protein
MIRATSPKNIKARTPVKPKFSGPIDPSLLANRLTPRRQSSHNYMGHWHCRKSSLQIGPIILVTGSKKERGVFVTLLSWSPPGPNRGMRFTAQHVGFESHPPHPSSIGSAYLPYVCISFSEIRPSVRTKCRTDSGGVILNQVTWGRSLTTSSLSPDYQRISQVELLQFQ